MPAAPALPLADREVRLPQGTVCYRDVGSGPPIVFLHPLLANGLIWRKVVALLSDRFRCLVPDLPLGAHTVPLPEDAEITPATVARMAADFMAITYGSLSRRPVPREVLDNFVAALQHSAIQRDVGKFLRAISTHYTEEAARKLPGFTRPALVVWAKEDRFFPVEHAHRLAALLPDARLELVDDSYTLIQEDQPERLAELIAGFAG